MFVISSNGETTIKIAVAQDIYNDLTIRDHKVFLGRNQIEAEFKLDETIPSGLALLLSPLLKTGKMLTQGSHFEKLQLNYCRVAGPAIKLGPVVGVLLARKTDKGYSLPTGKEGRILAEMNEAATKRNILMYFFYADGVNFTRQIINGHRYIASQKGKGKWVRASFPLPDIIYNRITSRSRERENHVQLFLQKAVRKSIHVFNTRFLNKWEVHKSLYSNSITRIMLPETDRYSQEKLVYYLANFTEFFIKPTESSVGKGIIKIVVNSPQSYSYYRVGSKSGWLKCHTSMQLYKQLRIPEGEKYILQQGIDLNCIDGNVFDIRAQVQKNGQGQWQLTGAAVRIAAPGKFVTHVPNGGTKGNFAGTLQELYGKDSEKSRNVNKQLETIAQILPRVLEQDLGLNLAILSLDIGLDKEGRMWIIEANSKPASFDEDDIRQRHLNLLNDYFIFKSNFAQ
ncbi:Endospore coat-associated protein YheC/D [Syntrophomonas zehnderi OL-4]|uniref:Endospore coat-associated protein YheC/D n=1 Tax=Syntrophomonas zehnderi OL-4 TaxID=690567 RepID=A0A0E4GBR3_9FIRM|nr:YheC/YheD family protein [Syntrophomonas zehnderi]CFW96268.1 Endospore coat-associated protein YheC/D [Syntrophomonas zehnderi OL-4]